MSELSVKRIKTFPIYSHFQQKNLKTSKLFPRNVHGMYTHQREFIINENYMKFEAGEMFGYEIKSNFCVLKDAIQTQFF